MVAGKVTVDAEQASDRLTAGAELARPCRGLRLQAPTRTDDARRASASGSNGGMARLPLSSRSSREPSSSVGRPNWAASGGRSR